MYNFVMFDVDGTLIDTQNAVIESYQKVIVEEFGRRFTEQELTPSYGIPTPQSMKALGFKDIDRACSRYYEYVFEAFAEVKPYEGIVELLEEIASKKYRGV